MAIPKPTLIPVPFARDGDKSNIPTVATNQDSNYCNFTEGFPVITETPIEAGGLPPQRTDFNSILYLLSSNIAYQNAGGMFWFDATYAAAIDGYSKGAVLLSDDMRYGVISLVDNNTHNFNANGLANRWAIIFNLDDVGGVPIGTCISYCGVGAVPDGYLDCNGAAYRRVGAYEKLFAAIGTRYGAGDGSTTFNVPDLRGYFLRFWSNGWNGRDPDGSTRNIGSTQGDLIRSHTHSITDRGHTHTQNSHSHGVNDPGHAHGYEKLRNSNSVIGHGVWLNWPYNQWENVTTGSSRTGISINSATAVNNTSTTDITINAYGGAETRPKNMVLRGLIKYK